VIGITLNDFLIDGGLTTQPQHSAWFVDVGWSLENYGTEPDIEVEIRPQDYLAGQDPQLSRAIEEVMRLIATEAPQLPSFGDRPKLPLPTLPDSE